jgi:hypothetical protein
LDTSVINPAGQQVAERWLHTQLAEQSLHAILSR